MYIWANCFPEMKKDRTYKIQLQLERDTLHISGAECGCPAGRGPVASCKHIGALCYVLEKFGRLKEIPDYRTCTDQLQATFNFVFRLSLHLVCLLFGTSSLHLS